jgi:hypothetical protein
VFGGLGFAGAITSDDGGGGREIEGAIQIECDWLYGFPGRIRDCRREDPI